MALYCHRNLLTLCFKTLENTITTVCLLSCVGKCFKQHFLIAECVKNWFQSTLETPTEQHSKDGPKRTVL